VSVRTDVLAALNGMSGVLNSRAWRDSQVPTETALPYCTYLDDVSAVPSLSGDGHTTAIEELAQVDLWQPGGTGVVYRDQVWRTLDGLLVASGMCRVRVRSAPRIPDPDRDLDHYAFTIAIQRRAPR
jgi:hypothetical protein